MGLVRSSAGLQNCRYWSTQAPFAQVSLITRRDFVVELSRLVHKFWAANYIHDLDGEDNSDRLTERRILIPSAGHGMIVCHPPPAHPVAQTLISKRNSNCNIRCFDWSSKEGRRRRVVKSVNGFIAFSSISCHGSEVSSGGGGGKNNF